MKMFVDQNMRFGSNSHSAASSFSSSSSINSSFSADASNWDSSSIVDTPLPTPTRVNFDLVKLEEASLCTPTPSCTPERNGVDAGFYSMTSISQDMLSGYSDPSMIFAVDGKLLSDQAMMGYNNFATYVGPTTNSFSNQSCLSLDSQSFDGDMFSPISDLGHSPTEDFVVPSQTTFMDTFDFQSPLRSAKTLQLSHSYDTPISEYDSGFEQFVPTYHEAKSCSTTPPRPSPLRQPVLSPLPTTAALQRVQEQSGANKEELKRILAARKTRRAIKRAGREFFLPNNVHCVKLADKQCPFEGCTKRFVRQEHLKRHERTHTQEDSYPCEFCQRPFGRPDNLKSHIKLHTFPHKKSSRTSYYPEAQEVYDRMSRKSSTKSEKLGLPTRSRARPSGY